MYCMTVIATSYADTRARDVLVSGSGDGSIKLWGMGSLGSSGLMQKHKFKISGHNVLSLAYQGIFLYAGLSDGNVYVFSLLSKQLIQKLSVSYGDVNTMQLSNGLAYCGTSQGIVKVCRHSC